MQPGELRRENEVTNRRTAHRHDVSLPAELIVGGETHAVTIENVSLGGLQLRFGERLSMGQRVRVQFSVPTDTNAYEASSIAVDAVVRWSNEDSVGLQFDGLRARDVWALNQFFARIQSPTSDG